jgi:hypothetical protein
MSDNNLYKFPSQFVYWKKIENHEKIKNNILPLILDHSDKLSLDEKNTKYCERYKCKTNFFCKDKFLSELFKKYNYEQLIIWNVIDNMLNNKDLNITRYPLRSTITDIWYNVYSPGGYHEVHTHGHNPGLSGIYILDLNEKNTTNFFNPGNIFLQTYLPLDNLEEGYVIIFPNDLSHFVNPSLEKRVTLSFNIRCYFND